MKVLIFINVVIKRFGVIFYDHALIFYHQVRDRDYWSCMAGDRRLLANKTECQT
jgi:hypothetical protein